MYEGGDGKYRKTFPHIPANHETFHPQNFVAYGIIRFRLETSSQAHNFKGL